LDSINFEEFISFLDIEHFLWLKGSDTLTDEGNAGQMIIKNLIALVLHLKQKEIPSSTFDLYREFAKHLEPGDHIITFNYDTILETVLNELSIPYRLYPTRLTEVSKVTGVGTVKLPEEEVILLKMHGSIDWFDKREFNSTLEYYDSIGFHETPRHPVFDNPTISKPIPLVDSTYFDSPLTDIFRTSNLDAYFNRAPFALNAPLIVSPSLSKMLYINPLREFWHGDAKSGSGFNRMAIIGFSLAQHDDYIRQPIYHLVRNFQFSDTNIFGNPRSKVVLVDYRKDSEAITEYRNNYRFVDFNKAIEHYSGFNSEAVNLIFG